MPPPPPSWTAGPKSFTTLPTSSRPSVYLHKCSSLSFWVEDTGVADQASNAKRCTIVETSWPAETHFPPAVRLKHPHRMQIACHIKIQSTEAWHKATAQTHQMPIQVTGLVRVAIPLESRVHVNDSGVVDHAPHCKGCNTVQASGRTEISVPCAVRLNAASRLQMACQVSAKHMPTLDCR